MIFANKMNDMSSAIFTVLKNKMKKLISEGREVYDLSIGTPDLPPAPHIIKALQDAAGLAENYKYAIADLPELMDAVMYWYNSRYGVTLAPEEITSLLGSQEGLAHISLALADPGDTIMVPDPGYPIFSVGPALASAKLYRMPLLPKNNYLIDFDAIDNTAAHAAKMMIVSYPNNPVTAVAPPDFYEKLVWFAKKFDIVVVHDNAYSELVFEGKKGASFLGIPGAKDVGVEFNSLSKSYNMTGCRISFALGNQKVIGQLKILKSHTDYGVFLPIQKAAIAAIAGPQYQLAGTVQHYEQRRNILIEGLDQLGWHVEKPKATMFVWAPIPKGYSSSEAFTLDLIEKTGVIVVPGSSFGSNGEGFVRIALVQPEQVLRKALESIRQSGILSR